MDFADFVTAFAIAGPLALLFSGWQMWQRRASKHWRDRVDRYAFWFLAISALTWILAAATCYFFGKTLRGGEPAYFCFPGLLWIIRLNFLLILAALLLTLIGRLRQIPALIIAALGSFCYWNLFLFD